MARWKRAAAVLAAAASWKQRCLLEGKSLLADEPLWNPRLFGELRTYYVEQPDLGEGSFEEKLRRQLAPAPPEAKRLWAEMTWAYDLIATNLKRVTKLDRIRTVWEWSGEPLPESRDVLGEVLAQGAAHPGPDRRRWFEFRFIITTMIGWFSLPGGLRESLLADPWRFVEWLDSQEGSRSSQFRHAVLFLLFPDSFERIVTSGHKRKIVEAFRSAGLSQAADSMPLADLDRALLAIREGLEAKHPGSDVDFYEAPLEQEWRPPRPDAKKDEHRKDAGDDAWYRERFGNADVWAIAPGAGARMWPEFRKQGIVAISYDEGGIGDLAEYDSRETVHRALKEAGYGHNPSNDSLALWQFAHEMRIGDYLIAKQGRSALLGWGRVTGAYRYDPERSEYRHVRDVDWHPLSRSIRLDRPIAMKTLTRFSRDRRWLRNHFPDVDDVKPPPSLKPYDIRLALEELFVDQAQLSRILDAVALRKNLILQGPPGVGKTFIARRIAWCLLGGKDPRRIEMVQFHQSYAYEDFVQGWRPNEEGGFTRRDGVFFEFCQRAEQEPETPFVFIIDEINRGNLSRIFGELLMLVESDKRGPDHAIPLTYSTIGERFCVPENIHLLGLMNTADRSLAMVDYALRRRFAFETLRPAYGEKFRAYLLEADVEPELVKRIVERMADLNESIRADKDLGPGFEIGHSHFVTDLSGDADERWYRTVVDTQIAPLLREYWFDRSDHAESLIEKLRQ